jgi:hypothetical protein
MTNAELNAKLHDLEAAQRRQDLARSSWLAGPSVRAAYAYAYASHVLATLDEEYSDMVMRWQHEEIAKLDVGS